MVRRSGVTAAEGNAAGRMADMALVKAIVVLSLAAVGLCFCYLLSLPFLPALTWALVLAVILFPVHRRIERRVGKRSLSALISVVAALIALGIPLLLILQQLMDEAGTGARFLEQTLRDFDWQEFRGSQPRLAEAAAWIGERLNVASALEGLAGWLTGQSTTLLRGSVVQVVGVALTFYMLFYFLRDRREALRALVAYSPLTAGETMRLARRFADTARASIFGTVIVGIVQGTLGGSMFWWLGLPTPVFWGLIMAVLAIIPMLGAFVIWVPAAIILVLQGEWLDALLLAIWGGVIIATIDNLLYPVLVGNRLRLHTLVAFIGTVGGVILFGAAGLVLGPAIITLTLELMEIVKQRSRLERSSGDGEPFDVPVVEPGGFLSGGSDHGRG